MDQILSTAHASRRPDNIAVGTGKVLTPAASLVPVQRDRRASTTSPQPLGATASGPVPHEPRWPRLQAARSGYRRLVGLSWPRRYPIVQFPNAPLILAFIAGQAAARLHGMAHDDALAISYLAMTVWAYEELFHGVNRFRNLLGLAYVLSTAIHLARALHH